MPHRSFPKRPRHARQPLPITLRVAPTSEAAAVGQSHTLPHSPCRADPPNQCGIPLAPLGTSVPCARCLVPGSRTPIRFLAPRVRGPPDAWSSLDAAGVPSPLLMGGPSGTGVGPVTGSIAGGVVLARVRIALGNQPDLPTRDDMISAAGRSLGASWLELWKELSETVTSLVRRICRMISNEAPFSGNRRKCASLPASMAYASGGFGPCSAIRRVISRAHGALPGAPPSSGISRRPGCGC